MIEYVEGDNHEFYYHKTLYQEQGEWKGIGG
jgi:hypothetical protein